MIKGRPDPPKIIYYFCETCNAYYKELGYRDIPQPCKRRNVCKSFVMPTEEPRYQCYVCPVCWMYFELRSEPNEAIECKRMGCLQTVQPNLFKPDLVYVKGGVFVPPVPEDKTHPKTSCYFLCRCTIMEGNYWIDHDWNPTITQYCNTCKCDVYPVLQPPPHRQHVGYFHCRQCSKKWKSEQAYPDVPQSCPECATSAQPLCLDVKNYKDRGINTIV